MKHSEKHTSSGIESSAGAELLLRLRNLLRHISPAQIIAMLISACLVFILCSAVTDRDNSKPAGTADNPYTVSCTTDPALTPEVPIQDNYEIMIRDRNLQEALSRALGSEESTFRLSDAYGITGMSISYDADSSYNEYSFQGLENLPNLASLTLNTADDDIQPALRGLAALPALEYLSLNGFSLDRENSRIHSCQNLAVLTIDRCIMTSAFCSSLSLLRSLTVLDIKDCSVHNGEMNMEMFRPMDQVRDLTLRAENAGDLIDLSGIENFTGLNSLDLSGNTLLLNIRGIEAAAKLENLNFESTSIADYRPLEKLTHLAVIKSGTEAENAESSNALEKMGFVRSEPGVYIKEGLQ